MTFYQKVCDTIFKLYLYGDMAKMIHYSTDSAHGHKLSDEVREAIVEFADDLAEQFFGYYGKPRFDELSLNVDVNKEEDLNKLCQLCLQEIEEISSEIEKNKKLSGIMSLIDNFKEKISKISFLGTFDKVSNFKLKK